MLRRRRTAPVVAPVAETTAVVPPERVEPADEETVVQPVAVDEREPEPEPEPAPPPA
jgi:hypothetical protein